MIQVKLETPPNEYWLMITRKLNITVSEGIKDVARLASERAAKATFPSGTSNKTKESLEKTIYKDVSRAYFAIPDNNLPTESGEYLLRHRNNRGRVSEGTNKKFISFEDYEYISDRFIERAGIAKAGWLQAAKELRQKSRIPKWLRKEIDLADVIVKKDYVIVINRVKYASNMITDKKLKNVMENAFTGLYKRASKIKF